jgi:hypothetical protein
VLHIVHSIRSEALLIEQFDFNLLFRWFVSLAICLLTGPAGIALASSPTRAAWTASRKARCTFVAVPFPQFAVRIVRRPATKFGSRPAGSDDAGQQSAFSIRYGPQSCADRILCNAVRSSFGPSGSRLSCRSELVMFF